MSIGAPLGIDVSSNTGPAEQGLDRLNQKLVATEQQCKKATLAARDMNHEMGKQLKAGAEIARGTGASEGFRGIAHGMETGGLMGMASAVAGIGATMYEVVKRFTDLAEESAKRRLEFEDEITKSAESAKSARGASAERGLSQEQAYRKAMYAGGPEAVKRADAMIAAGTDPAEAYAAAADSQNAASIYGHKRVSSLLARIAGRGGNVTDAAKKLRDRPWMMENQNESELAGDLMGLRPEERSVWGDYNIGDDFFLNSAKAARAIKGKTALADRNNAANGEANAGRSREFRMASNPEGELRGDAINALNKSLDKIDRMATEQGKVAKLLADVFLPGGSFETQLIRAMRDRDRVLAGD